MGWQIAAALGLAGLAAAVVEIFIGRFVIDNLPGLPKRGKSASKVAFGVAGALVLATYISGSVTSRLEHLYEITEADLEAQTVSKSYLYPKQVYNQLYADIIRSREYSFGTIGCPEWFGMASLHLAADAAPADCTDSYRDERVFAALSGYHQGAVPLSEFDATFYAQIADNFGINTPQEALFDFDERNGALAEAVEFSLFFIGLMVAAFTVFFGLITRGAYQFFAEAEGG